MMSALDWDMVAKLPAPKSGEPGVPAREMDITDGQKLTLGNTTLTMYITPGHTPGTVSMLVPVTDKGRSHLLSFWGGSAIPRELGPTGQVGRMDAGMLAYKQSFDRFFKIGEEAGVEGISPIIPTAIRPSSTARPTESPRFKPASRGAAPFIDRGTYIRYFMISVECIEAQEGWVRAGRPSVGPWTGPRQLLDGSDNLGAVSHSLLNQPELCCSRIVAAS
jgi:metallo-beta-lactamase class B